MMSMFQSGAYLRLSFVLAISVAVMAIIAAHLEPYDAAGTRDPLAAAAAIGDGQPDPAGSPALDFYKRTFRRPLNGIAGRDARSTRDRLGPVTACFAPGTPDEVMNYVNSLIQPGFAERYFTLLRWPGPQGTPLQLSWSFVPDGLMIPGAVGEPDSPSDLFYRLDQAFADQGGRDTWISRFESVFARWAALCGTSYTRIKFGGSEWDDGRPWGYPGEPDLRGDIRICMHPLDGAGGALAYNHYPGIGDMVLDSGEPWGQGGGPGGLNVFLRNVVSHEHGHGMGFLHVCPADGTKLMEPYSNTSYDGPRHDDIRAAQYLYGDAFEENNSIQTATDLGTVEQGSPIVLGPVPGAITGDVPPNSSLAAISGDGDEDFYRFTVTGRRTATINVVPIGLTYDSSPQGSNGCGSGNNVDSLAAADLNLQVIGSNGTTVLRTAAARPAGQGETAGDVLLPVHGTYFVRVYKGGSSQTAQMYRLRVSVVQWPHGAGGAEAGGIEP